MWTTIKRVQGNEQQLRTARYGVIEFRAGQLVSIQTRPWPKIASKFEVWWCERFGWRRREGDCCRVYYNEPRGCPGYLTLPWMQSTAQTTLLTVFAALDLLDEIAELKRSDAIVCELANRRLSDRLMRRLGWTRHLESSARRHYIKRFDRAESNSPVQRELAESLSSVERDYSNSSG